MLVHALMGESRARTNAVCLGRAIMRTCAHSFCCSCITIFGLSYFSFMATIAYIFSVLTRTSITDAIPSHGINHLLQWIVSSASEM